MDKHHYVLIGLGALALYVVYKKANPSANTATADYTAQQASANPAWWNFAGSWQV